MNESRATESKQPTCSVVVVFGTYPWPPLGWMLPGPFLCPYLAGAVLSQEFVMVINGLRHLLTQVRVGLISC